MAKRKAEATTAEGVPRPEDVAEYRAAVDGLVDVRKHVKHCREVVLAREAEVAALPTCDEERDAEVAAVLGGAAPEQVQREDLIGKLDEARRDLEIAERALRVQTRVRTESKKRAQRVCREACLEQHREHGRAISAALEQLRDAVHSERRYLRSLRAAGIVGDLDATGNGSLGLPMKGLKVAFVGSGRGCSAKIDDWLRRKSGYLSG